MEVEETVQTRKCRVVGQRPHAVGAPQEDAELTGFPVVFLPMHWFDPGTLGTCFRRTVGNRVFGSASSLFAPNAPRGLGTVQDYPHWFSVKFLGARAGTLISIVPNRTFEWLNTNCKPGRLKSWISTVRLEVYCMCHLE